MSEAKQVAPADTPKRVRPTLTLKLQVAEGNLQVAQARIEELEKQLASAKSLYNFACQTRDRAVADLDQVHTFLDFIPSVLPRQRDEFNDHAAITRLATWLGGYLVPVNLAIPFAEPLREEPAPVEAPTTNTTEE